MHYVGLYFEFLKLSIMSVAEYRKAFILGGIAQFATYGAEFMVIWVLVTKFQVVNGWVSYEIMFLYALNLASYALAAFFLFNPCTKLSTMIRNGTFDEILTKPLNSLLYLMSREINNAYYSHFLLAVIIMMICFDKLQLHVTLLTVIWLSIVLIGGAFIQAAGFIFTSVPSFWVIESNGIRQVLFFQMRSFIRYPISIYPKFIQFIITVIIPYAFINFYPAQFFLNKNDFSIFHPLFQFLCPVVGIILVIMAYRFWCFGITRYQSTGS